MAVICAYASWRNPEGKNNHLHFGFLKKAFTAAGHTFVEYGPVKGRETGVVPYSPNRPINDVLRALRADVFLQVAPKTSAQYLARVTPSVPTVLYVCDLHSYRGPLYRADVVLLRAKQHEKMFAQRAKGSRAGNIRWLPFSFDAEVMQRVAEPAKRARTVSFCGHTNAPPSYPVRRGAIRLLRAAELLTVTGRCSLREYYTFLKSCALSLTCSTRWRYAVAKHVEIPAAGALLLTDGPVGMDELLPAHLYVRYTLSTVVQQVRAILQDEGRLKKALVTAKLARAYTHLHHTDAVRGTELCSYLQQKGVLPT